MHMCNFCCIFAPKLFNYTMSSTKAQLIEELKVLLEQDVTAVKDQVEHIKTLFYKDGADGQEAESESEEFAALEEQFKAIMAEYKAKKAEAAAKAAKEQEANLARKQAILAEMKTLAEGETDGVIANLQRMRELQAEWKTIGAVPADKVQETRKDYQKYQEQFYDLVKINIELRDLDFKKNLEMKTLLCEAAERLENNENIVEASRALQQLHDEWAEIGPVARELREDLWNRFKAASTIINKKHQAHFDELHAKEQANLDAKRAIIEQLKAINEPIGNAETLSAKKWEELTQKIQDLQNEWRKIGFAPKKFNQSIYDEYRSECDRFFQAKTAYFKGIRDTFNENLKQKRSILDRAKAIVEGTNVEMPEGENIKIDWAKSADELRELQAEWKTIGPVARKYSDELWAQFSELCDSFFNAKREAIKDERMKAKDERAAKAVRAAASKGAEGLRHMRDRLQQEIKTAENNILFFTAKSKTANKLVESMQKKIDELKKQLDDVQTQLDNEE